MFTKRHYIAIAKFIKELDIPLDSKSTLVTQLCLFFSEDNDKFDPIRFNISCGV